MDRDKHSYLQDYISGNTGDIAFFERSFFDQADRAAAVSLAADRGLADETYAALEAHNLSEYEQVRSSLEKLKSGKAAVVVTGQQLGFLGGPLLTLYKALTAARAAALLEQESGHPVVPIFWLQSEDHDYEEIRSASFLNQAGQRVDFDLPIEEGIGQSVGDLLIPSNPLPEGLLSHLSDNREIFEELCVAYTPGAPLSSAYRQVLGKVLAPLGVLLFDFYAMSDRAAVKDLVMTCFRECSEISKVLIERSHALEGCGYDIQVRVRKDSPLFFITEEGVRARVASRSAGIFRGRTRDFSLDDVEDLLIRSPQSVTASALIRPLVQDALFPTAAYVAGPGEFNYWVQIKPLYDYFKIPQPVIVPRASFTLIEHRQKRLLEKLGVSVASVSLSEQEFISQRHAGSEISADAVFSEPRQQIQTIFAGLDPKVSALNPVLSASVNKTEQAVMHNLGKLEAKYESSLRARDEAAIGQLRRLKEALLPEGLPQERVISFMYFLAKYGLDFVRTIYDNVNLSEPGARQEIFLDD